MQFVGIDLAWSPHHRSGGVVVSDSGEVVQATGNLRANDEIVAFVQAAIPDCQPGVVAVDAPLIVPNETSIRPCDRQVSAVFGRFEAGPYPANRRNLTQYGGQRIWKLADDLTALGFRLDPDLPRRQRVRRLVEVFPHPAIVSLFNLERSLKYKARKGLDYATRWEQLDRLRAHLAALSTADPPLFLPPEVAGMEIVGRRGHAFKLAEDILDALVCAYTAFYAWFHGPRGTAVYGWEAPQEGEAGGGEHGHILVPMTPQMWQRIKQPRLLLLDRDDTLNETLGERPPNHPSEVRLRPGIGRRLRHYAAMGWRLIIITNQGGQAFGYMNEAEALRVHQAVLDALPVTIDASYLCPHHAKGSVTQYAIECPFRKPAPGAVLDALARFAARSRDCLLVGDMETDRQAAEAAGVPFRWAREFF